MNTAEYIEKELLGKPEGYPVWLKFDDCHLIYKLLLKEKIFGNEDEDVTDLYNRFKTQYKFR